MQDEREKPLEKQGGHAGDVVEHQMFALCEASIVEALQRRMTIVEILVNQLLRIGFAERALAVECAHSKQQHSGSPNRVARNPVLSGIDSALSRWFPSRLSAFCRAYCGGRIGQRECRE